MAQLDPALLRQIHTRFATRASLSSIAAAEGILATRFQQQVQFIGSKFRRKAAFCTRRAGKTECVAAYLLTTGLLHRDSLCIFVAITRLRAKQLVWDALKKMAAQFNLCDAKAFNETELTVRLANGSIIRLTGADKIKEADKKKGDKARLVMIDEAQLFPAEVLKYLVEDVYGPSLEDLQGTLCLSGTPGVVCAGYWWDVTQPDRLRRAPGWEVHEWSVLDNPYMGHMRARLPEIKKERGWTDDNPTWLREWCGRWVNDASALFYKFDPSRNTYDELPLVDPLGRPVSSGDWQHVLGWDIGLDDAMALVVWGFCQRLPNLYEVHSWAESGVTTPAVMERVRALEQQFSIIARVADTGGLGKLIVEEQRQREGMHFEAAKKTEKYSHVELMNDDLLSGRVLLMRGSVLAQEMSVLPKDPNWPKPGEERNKPPREDPRFPNHACDAGLYGWRKAQHWLFTPEQKLPEAGSIRAAEIEARRMEMAELEAIQRESEAAWFEREDR